MYISKLFSKNQQTSNISLRISEKPKDNQLKLPEISHRSPSISFKKTSLSEQIHLRQSFPQLLNEIHQETPSLETKSKIIVIPLSQVQQNDLKLQNQLALKAQLVKIIPELKQIIDQRRQQIMEMGQPVKNQLTTSNLLNGFSMRRLLTDSERSPNINLFKKKKILQNLLIQYQRARDRLLEMEREEEGL